MKILLLNITGRFGSTGKIVNDIRSYLIENRNDAIIVHGHSDKILEKGFFQIDKPIEAKIISQFTKLGRAQYKGNPFALPRLTKIIKEYNPDVVHVHCINGLLINVYKLFKYLSTNKIKTVITHHAEFFYTGSCPYSFSCTHFIDKQCTECKSTVKATSNRINANPHKNWLRMFKAINSFCKEDVCFVAVSPWVYERSLLSPIVKSYKCQIVYNGINTDIFKYQYSPTCFSKICNLKKKVVLHVTHQFSSSDIDGIKGGGYVTELAKMMQDVTFIVVASDIIDVRNIPFNMYVWGRTDSQMELVQLYSTAHVTLLTSKRETFSMVVAESLCCGTPVVGFTAGGPESIGVKKYCTFVEYGNIEALRQAVKNCLVKNYDKNKISMECTPVYSKERMGKEYLSIYSKLIN